MSAGAAVPEFGRFLDAVRQIDGDADPADSDGVPLLPRGRSGARVRRRERTESVPRTGRRRRDHRSRQQRWCPARPGIGARRMVPAHPRYEDPLRAQPLRQGTARDRVAGDAGARRARFNGVGAGLTCGYEWGPAIGTGYTAPFPFSGTIRQARIETRGPVASSGQHRHLAIKMPVASCEFDVSAAAGRRVTAGSGDPVSQVDPIWAPRLSSALSPGFVRKVRSMSKQVRLTEPLVRDDGRLRPASWDEALDRAAAGFAVARQRDATKSFGMFSCSKATNEMNYMAQKFTRAVMGSNNIDSCNRT